MLADIHWGKSKNPQFFYEEIKELIIDRLDKLKVLDAIIICGDFWDRVISLHHPTANWAIHFIQDLLKLCNDKNCKLRVVMGTRSHDNDLLKWFHIVNRSNSYTVDISVINSVSEEQLFEDTKVLYIPEEYVTSYENHYEEYFIKDKYDMIFGHGLIDKASFAAVNQESELTSPSAPIIKSEDLLNICKGPIFFGHIHTRMTFYNRIHYVGSISRFAHGEEEDKGFYMLYYTPDNNNFKSEFIINEKAPEYKTLKYIVEDQDRMVLFNDIKKDVLDTQNTYENPNIRVKVSINKESGEDKSFIMSLTREFSNTKNVKLLISTLSKEKQIMERDRAAKEIMDEYSFLFDDNIDIDIKITKYISKKKHKDLTPDRVRQILYEKYLK